MNYYVSEATSQFSTTSSINLYALPTNFARMRSVFDTTRNVEMQYADIREMDRSPSTTTGPPAFYAFIGPGLQLYPTPDAVYPLELRYWQMPAQLIQDTDVPSIPTDYHSMLWVYAVAQCYWADDDQAMGQAWDQKFATDLSEFSADQKFPDTDGPTQVQGMWDSDESLSSTSAWGFYGSY